MLNSLVAGSRPILLAQFASEHDSRARFRFIASKKATFLFKASSIRKRNIRSRNKNNTSPLLRRIFSIEKNILRLFYNQRNACFSMRFLSNLPNLLFSIYNNNKTTVFMESIVNNEALFF